MYKSDFEIIVNFALVGQFYDLLDISTIEKFKLNPTENYVKLVSYYDNISVLQYLKDNNEFPNDSIYIIIYACNKLETLNWINDNMSYDNNHNSASNIIYCVYTMCNNESKKTVLDCMFYTCAKCDNIDVFDWLISNKYYINNKNINSFLRFAFLNASVNILNKVVNDKIIKINLLDFSIVGLSYIEEKVKILEWLKHNYPEHSDDLFNFLDCSEIEFNQLTKTNNKRNINKVNQNEEFYFKQNKK